MISIKPTDWSIRFSPGMPRHPSGLDDGAVGWKFDFPLWVPKYDDDGQPVGFSSVNYVTTKKKSKLQVGQVLDMTFRVDMSPDVVFEHTRTPPIDPRPAAVRFYLQKGLGNRWWSNPVSAALVDSKYGKMLVVELNPSSWSDVHGQLGDKSRTTLKNFKSAVGGADAVGMTFGGPFFGHGVWLSSGTATFSLLDYAVVEG